MKTIFLLLLLITTVAYPSIPPTNQEQVYQYTTPLNGNPGFELGTYGWTTSEASTLTKTTTASAVHSGSAAGVWDPSTAGTLLSGPTGFVPNANREGVLVAECWVKTSDPDYDLEIYDQQAAAVVATKDIVTDGTNTVYSQQKLTYMMNASSSSRSFFLRLRAYGNESAIDVDDCKLYFDPGAFPVNVDQVYSARVTSAGAVSAENVDWINGSCAWASGVATCTLTTGLTTVGLNCTADMVTTGNNRYAKFTSTTASAITVKVTDNAGSAVADDFSVICQKADPTPGYAVRMDQTNFGWTDGGALVVTATTTAPTLGSATVPTNKMWYKRNGSNLDVRFEFAITAAGTATAGTGDYLFAIPAGLTIDTSKLTVYTTVVGNAGAFKPLNTVGSFSGNSNTNGIVGGVYVYDTTRVRLGGKYSLDAGGSTATAIISAGFGAWTTGITNYSATFSVPILGWSENMSAPMIIGGVTSSYLGTIRFDSAKVATTGTVSQEYGDLVNGNCTNASPQVCTLNSGLYSAIPNCWVQNMDTGSTTSCSGEATSTTNVNIKCQNDAGTGTTTSVNKTLFCMGPR
jgi:hypothetical protein